MCVQILLFLTSTLLINVWTGDGGTGRIKAGTEAGCSATVEWLCSLRKDKQSGSNPAQI